VRNDGPHHPTGQSAAGENIDFVSGVLNFEAKTGCFRVAEMWQMLFRKDRFGVIWIEWEKLMNRGDFEAKMAGIRAKKWGG